ncbi:MAG TPA: hypothetical protein VMG12_07560 [Polyangiaceae bacterium]|nr:hypothetical protein [Polyangiaceae bacterium]
MLDWCRRLAPCALVSVIGASFACKEDETRPGYAQDCNDPECLDARGDSFPRPLPTGPGEGSGGTEGSGGASGTGEISGTVLEVASEDLVTTQSLRGEVDVRAANATSGEDDVIVQPGADGSYRMDGIVRGEGVWVGVGNFEDPPIEPFTDTIQVVDSRRAGITDLHVVRTDMLRDLARSSFLNGIVDLDLERAHLIIRFVDADNEPVEGVQITYPDPQSVATAYDAGDIYSDALDATSARGMAILLNQEAPEWPGTSADIYANLDGASQLTARVRLVRGSVTVVSAVVPDP